MSWLLVENHVVISIYSAYHTLLFDKIPVALFYNFQKIIHYFVYQISTQYILN